MENDKHAFYDDGRPFSGPDVIALVKKIVGDEPILLSFSGGKDSLALWLTLRDHFETIPFFMYIIPDLEFVEATIRYYERWFDQHIIRLPHPSLYRMLNNFVHQPPDRIAYIRSLNLVDFSYDDLSMLLGRQHGITNVFTATGVRAADSPNRRSSIMKHSPVTWSRRYFYPIWDMKMDGLIGLLGKHKIKLSVDYRLFGRSFDGIDHRFCHIIKREFPDDYKKILEWFPLVELELMRYEY